MDQRDVDGVLDVIFVLVGGVAFGIWQISIPAGLFAVVALGLMKKISEKG